MIEISHLSKNYGKIKALNDVSFNVKNGEILGFLGPNGAGKSTAMNIITGYLAPTSGTIKIDGVDITEDPIGVKKKIGYLPELPPLYGDMTVKEYLDFIADFKGVDSVKKKRMLDDIMYLTQIGDKRDRLVKNLSKGYRQRVGVAQALVGDPPILILDEPTVGLDPRQVIEFRKIVSALGRNHTVILSTHILSEVTAVCNSVVIINGGKLAAQGAVSDFSTSADKSGITIITIETDRPRGQVLLESVEGVESVAFARIDKGSSVFRVTAKRGADIRKSLFNKCSEANVAILEMKAVSKSLEEFFVDVISKDAVQAEEEE